MFGPPGLKPGGKPNEFRATVVFPLAPAKSRATGRKPEAQAVPTHPPEGSIAPS